MPPRNPSKSLPIPVESVHHTDKRTNIPTADAHHFVTDEIERPRKLLYPRDHTLDPQLVWKGKDDQDSEDLLVDAPPIYIQEKIDPRVLIENLRTTAKADEPEPEAHLFEMFDGLDEFSAVDFYHHDANWSNRMILGDSLQVMASLAERENLRGQVQMIYIDPPYGIKFGSNWQLSVRSREVKDGKIADVVREAEQIKAFRDTWELGIHSYLTYLRDRLISSRDLLTESGSIFVQISDENVHLVRSLLDECFGAENFVSQISFATTSGFVQAKGLGRSGDYLLWYAKNAEQVKTRQVLYKASERQGYNWIRLPDGTSRGLTKTEKQDSGLLPTGARVYKPDNIVSQGSASTEQPFEYRGRTYSPPANSHWKASYPAGMSRLALAGRIHVAKNSVQYVRYPDDFGWRPYSNNWTDTATGNFTDDKIYVVQTGSKTIERCMLLCTDPGDLVLDPTCGSGTTAAVAEQWARRWITIDTSRVSLALARQRLMAAKYPYYELSDSADGAKLEAGLTGTAMTPPSGANDVRRGFVYKRVPHITLGSIANNPDIKAGMSDVEIAAAIAKHSESENLLDQPYEAKGKVRVSGPFTVESLSPHRALSFDEGTSVGNESMATSSDGGLVDDQPFEQSILDNLLKAGIQNGKKSERLALTSIEPYPGTFMQAVATTDAGGGRVGLALGPQYGTVSPSFIKKAAREAIEAEDIDLLCVLGFAFDPQATNITKEDGVTVDASDAGFAEVSGQRKLGKVNVLFVRMNSDLLMGEDLKKTGVGNLFTVFGEPDIDVVVDAGQVTVELKGVDVFDPNTSEVRSAGTDRIALWMIDTCYNEESFFVRHCYFTGGGDPFKKLKATLRAEINADAWDSLQSTTSRPFSKPDTGKIAVKVINDYGDEVMKVFEV